jgi:hypothetical protein
LPPVLSYLTCFFFLSCSLSTIFFPLPQVTEPQELVEAIEAANAAKSSVLSLDSSWLNETDTYVISLSAKTQFERTALGQLTVKKSATSDPVVILPPKQMNIDPTTPFIIAPQLIQESLCTNDTVIYTWSSPRDNGLTALRIAKPSAAIQTLSSLGSCK